MRLGIGFLLLTLLMTACSTRGLNNHFASATEQRLVTRSLDKLIEALPAADFQPLAEKPVSLQCYFIVPTVDGTEYSPLLDFACRRVKMELLERFGSRVVDAPEEAEYQVHFFFNAIGTDQDSLGISTPELYLPGIGAAKIDFIALEMFHGVSEGYYYIIDRRNAQTIRGMPETARVRIDRLNLPFVSLPLHTLD